LIRLPVRILDVLFVDGLFMLARVLLNVLESGRKGRRVAPTVLHRGVCNLLWIKLRAALDLRVPSRT